MPLRLWRRFKVGPFRMNVSKRGVSYSIGRRGLWLTANKRGLRTSVGIPGTGLGYYHQDRWAAPTAKVRTPAIKLWGFWLAVAGLIAFAIWY